MALDDQNGRTLASLEEWRKNVDEKLDHIRSTLDCAFTPEGFCSRSRSKVGWLVAIVSIHSLLLTAVIIAIVQEWVRK